MQSRASALLAKTGRYHDLHAKQILRVAERERLTAEVLATADGAALVARRLGAQRAIFGTLTRIDGGWTLTASAVTVGGKGPRTPGSAVKLPAALPQAVDEGALALARLVAGPDGATIAAPAAPLTRSAEAMAAYASCHATLIRQPIVVETPVVLDEPQLRQAIASCRAAVAADPQFQEARSALGLALALAGQDAEAVEALAKVQQKDNYLPLYWLGRYWLVTRYQSADAGAIALKTAIERHPYFLLAYGYLAEHEHALHHDAAALAAWKAYRTQLPDNNFIGGRISRSLARMGKNDEALAEARASLAKDPTDREASLELASRHLDAGHPDEAIAILRPLADDPQARAELVLRLAYAYLAKGDSTSAEKWLRRAEAAAQRPADWRTRARARLDLGVLLVKAGRTDEGHSLLVSSKRGGLANYIAALRDPELNKMVAQAEAAQAQAAKKGKPIEEVLFAPPTEASPFIIDGAGQIITDHNPPTAPRMFEVLRF
jgi:Flp pilus assembly protein TadD